jgi:hypothetical protein
VSGRIATRVKVTRILFIAGVKNVRLIGKEGEDNGKFEIRNQKFEKSRNGGYRSHKAYSV